MVAYHTGYDPFNINFRGLALCREIAEKYRLRTNRTGKRKMGSYLNIQHLALQTHFFESILIFPFSMIAAPVVEASV